VRHQDAERHHRNQGEVRHRHRLDEVHPDEVHHRHRLDVAHPDEVRHYVMVQKDCFHLVVQPDVEFPFPD
jgi:hypothetical protein